MMANPSLYYQSYEPKDPKAVLLLVHGLGSYWKIFQELGKHLFQEGYAAFIPDLPGFGHTEGTRGDLDHQETYINYLEELLLLAKAKYPLKKLFLAGESMGGLICLDYLLRHPESADGLILLSPGIRTKFRIPLTEQLDLAINLFLYPEKKYLLPFAVKDYTRDPEKISSLSEDPLMVWEVTARFYFLMSRIQKRVSRQPERIRLPLLLLQAGEDQLVDKEAVMRYYGKVGSKEKELKILDGHFHALHVDLGREKVFQMISEWLQKRL